MDTVSENLTVSIRLDNELSCDKICQRIQQLVNQANSHNKNLSNCILVIRITDVTEDNGMVPKLEVKN
jgi:hypothetical protein